MHNVQDEKCDSAVGPTPPGAVRTTALAVRRGGAGAGVADPTTTLPSEDGAAAAGSAAGGRATDWDVGGCRPRNVGVGKPCTCGVLTAGAARAAGGEGSGAGGIGEVAAGRDPPAAVGDGIATDKPGVRWGVGGAAAGAGLWNQSLCTTAIWAATGDATGDVTVAAIGSAGDGSELTTRRGELAGVGVTGTAAMGVFEEVACVGGGDTNPAGSAGSAGDGDGK